MGLEGFGFQAQSIELKAERRNDKRSESVISKPEEVIILLLKVPHCHYVAGPAVVTSVFSLPLASSA